MGGECWKHLTCGSCLSAADEDEGCFWCYSSGTCEEASVGTSPFGDCADVGMTAAACQCRPSVYTTCEECANVANLMCVWVGEGAEVHSTVEYSSFWGSVARQALPVATLTSGSCHAGWGFGAFGLVQNATLFNGGVGHLSVQMQVVPKEYFWAQCQLPNAGSALLMLAVILSAASILSFCMGALTSRPKPIGMV